MPSRSMHSAVAGAGYGSRPLTRARRAPDRGTDDARPPRRRHRTRGRARRSAGRARRARSRVCSATLARCSRRCLQTGAGAALSCRACNSRHPRPDRARPGRRPRQAHAPLATAATSAGSGCRSSAGRRRRGRWRTATCAACNKAPAETARRADARHAGSVGKDKTRAFGEHAVEQRFGAGRRIGDIAGYLRVGGGERDVFGDVAQKRRAQRGGDFWRQRRHQPGLDPARRAAPWP